MSKKTSKTKKTEGKVEVNGNLETFSNSQPKGRKSRFFSLTTYATEKQVLKVVGDHVSSIRALCYILHDKDESEPHIHILMRTHSTWTSPQITKWFADLKDKEKKPVNTFCEIANDMDALKRYIIHDTPEAREAGKYQYRIEDIKDYGMCDLSEKKDSYDSSYEILMRVLAGANPRDLVRYYGRDYLYHLNAYHECADKIREIEGYNDAAIRSRMNLFYEPNFKKVNDMEEFEEE